MADSRSENLDREFDPVADDAREVVLDEDGEPSPPPTLDPDERVEADEEDDEPLPDDERPV